MLCGLLSIAFWLFCEFVVARSFVSLFDVLFFIAIWLLGLGLVELLESSCLFLLTFDFVLNFVWAIFGLVERYAWVRFELCLDSLLVAFELHSNNCLSYLCELLLLSFWIRFLSMVVLLYSCVCVVVHALVFLVIAFVFWEVCVVIVYALVLPYVLYYC